MLQSGLAAKNLGRGGVIMQKHTGTVAGSLPEPTLLLIFNDPGLGETPPQSAYSLTFIYDVKRHVPPTRPK